MHTLSTTLVLALVLSYCRPSTLKVDKHSSGNKFVSSTPGLAMTTIDPPEEMPKALPMLSNEFMLKASAAAGAAVVGIYISEQPSPWSHTDRKIDIPDEIEVRRFLHVPYKFLAKLNEKWVGPVNFDRQGLRIGAMDTYAVLAGILLSTILGLFGSIYGNKPDDDAPQVEKITYDFQVFFGSVAAMASAWTMIIFLFNKIYCVKALSIYHDVNYAVFLSATREYRVRAFQSLIVAFVAYLIAYASVLLGTVKGKKGIAIAVGIVAFSVIMLMEASNIINEAQVLTGETPLQPVESDNYLL